MPVHQMYTNFINKFTRAVQDITGHSCSCSLRRAGTGYVIHWKLVETGEYGSFRMEHEEMLNPFYPAGAAVRIKQQIDWLDSIEEELEGTINGRT